MTAVQIAELAHEACAIRVLEAAHFNREAMIRARDGVHLVTRSGSHPGTAWRYLVTPRKLA